MVVIYWSDMAKSDLKHIFQYIAFDSPYYAKEHIKKLKLQTTILKKQPRVGRIVPEFGIETIREIIYHDYRIVYSIDSPKTVIILTVFHGSRLLSQPNP